MFDAWNFSDWIASLGAAVFIVGMVTGLSLVLGLAATVVFGKEEEALVTSGLDQETRRGTGTRHAA